MDEDDDASSRWVSDKKPKYQPSSSDDDSSSDERSTPSFVVDVTQEDIDEVFAGIPRRCMAGVQQPWISDADPRVLADYHFIDAWDAFKKHVVGEANDNVIHRLKRQIEDAYIRVAMRVGAGNYHARVTASERRDHDRQYAREIAKRRAAASLR